MGGWNVTQKPNPLVSWYEMTDMKYGVVVGLFDAYLTILIVTKTKENVLDY